ncbi:MAG: protein-glutamate O-methyltransferase CheR [Verrucomicrobia bacterium]|nr:protein-glutamate O-methyltransferase CheR [Verrucomicrobiota bacterium]
MMNPLQTLLGERVGLDLEAIPHASVLIRRRMARLGIEDEGAYAERVSDDPEEFEALVEEVAVPETWFFRDVEPFLFLQRLALSDAWPGGRVRRVLSLPCASGEEPYSIVIALLEAGLRPGQFAVDAADLSPGALRRAREAVYEPASFREKKCPFGAAFLRKDGTRTIVEDSVREAVQFRQANALNCAPLPGAPDHYDIIFCRNLLIYLTPEARRRVLDRLDRQLEPGGWMFLGHAELPHVFLPEYEPAPHPRAFAARKPETGTGRRSRTTGREISYTFSRKV